MNIYRERAKKLESVYNKANSEMLIEAFNQN